MPALSRGLTGLGSSRVSSPAEEAHSSLRFRATSFPRVPVSPFPDGEVHAHRSVPLGEQEKCLPAAGARRGRALLTGPFDTDIPGQTNRGFPPFRSQALGPPADVSEPHACSVACHSDLFLCPGHRPPGWAALRAQVTPLCSPGTSPRPREPSAEGRAQLAPLVSAETEPCRVRVSSEVSWCFCTRGRVCSPAPPRVSFLPPPSLSAAPAPRWAPDAPPGPGPVPRQA